MTESGAMSRFSSATMSLASPIERQDVEPLPCRRSGAGYPAVELECDDENVLTEDLGMGDHPLLQMLLARVARPRVRVIRSAGVAFAPSTV